MGSVARRPETAAEMIGNLVRGIGLDSTQKRKKRTMKTLDVEGPQAPQHESMSKYMCDMAILQPHGLLFAVDGVAWEWCWWLLMEVGGGWGQREKWW